MEYLDITHLGTGKGFQIEGFPDAEKVVKISGTKVQELTDMSLHMNDCNIAGTLLDLIETNTDIESQNALWEMAVIRVMKCYDKKSKARKFNLNPEEIIGNDEMGQEVFSYFKNLRNKNIAHDENSFMQCMPGAILNKLNSLPKIAKVICFSARGLSYADEDINNLRILIDKSKKFSQKRFDKLGDEISTDLETLEYSTLMGMPSLDYKKPTPEDVSTNRKKHIE